MTAGCFSICLGSSKKVQPIEEISSEYIDPEKDDEQKRDIMGALLRNRINRTYRKQQKKNKAVIKEVDVFTVQNHKAKRHKYDDKQLKVYVKSFEREDIRLDLDGKSSGTVKDIYSKLFSKDNGSFAQLKDISMKKGMMIREVVEAANLKERIDEQASIKMVFLKQHREFTLDAELFVISLYNENEAIWADKNVYGIMQFELLQRKLFVNASYLYLQPDSQDTHLLNLFEKCAIEFSKSKIIESMDLDKLLHEKLYGKNLTYAQTEEEYQQLYIEALLTSIQQRQASVTKMARKMVSLNDTEAKLATILELFSSDIFFDVDRLIPLFATVNFSPIFYALQSLLCMGCTFGTTTSFLSMNIIIIEHIRDGLKSIAKKDEEVNLLLQTSSTLAGRLKRVSSLYFDIQQPYYLSDKQTHRVFKLSILNSTVSLLAIYYGTESYGKQSPYARWIPFDDIGPVFDLLEDNLKCLLVMDLGAFTIDNELSLVGMESNDARLMWKAARFKKYVEYEDFTNSLYKRVGPSISESLWWKGVIGKHIISPLDVWKSVIRLLRKRVTMTVDSLRLKAVVILGEYDAQKLLSPSILGGLTIMYDLNMMGLLEKIGETSLDNIDSINKLLEEVFFGLQDPTMNIVDEINKGLTYLTATVSRKDELLDAMSGGAMMILVKNGLASYGEYTTNVTLEETFNQIKKIVWSSAMDILRKTEIDCGNSHVICNKNFDEWVKTHGLQTGITQFLTEFISEYGADISEQQINSLTSKLSDMKTPLSIPQRKSKSIVDDEYDELCTLQLVMRPLPIIGMNNELVRLLNQTGENSREWLLKDIKTQLINSSDVVWLSSPSGYGKSALCALAIQRWAGTATKTTAAAASEKGTQNVRIAGHFMFGPGKNTVRHLATTIAFQLAQQFPAYRKLLIKTQSQTSKCSENEVLLKLLVELPRSVNLFVGKNDIFTILIDAFDEATKNDQKKLIHFLKTTHTKFRFMIMCEGTFDIISSIADAQRQMLEDTGKFKPDLRTSSFKLWNLISPEYRTNEKYVDDINALIKSRLQFPDHSETSSSDAQTLLLAQTLKDIALKSDGPMLWINVATDIIRVSHASSSGKDNDSVNLIKESVTDMAEQLKKGTIELYENVIKSLFGSFISARYGDMTSEIYKFLAIVTLVKRPMRKSMYSTILLQNRDRSANLESISDAIDQIVLVLRQRNILVDGHGNVLHLSHKSLRDLLWEKRNEESTSGFYFPPTEVLFSSQALVQYGLRFVTEAEFWQSDTTGRTQYWSLYWAWHFTDYINNGLKLASSKAERDSFFEVARKLMQNIQTYISNSTVMKWMRYMGSKGLIEEARICCDDLENGCRLILDFLHSGLSTLTDSKLHLQDVADSIVKQTYRLRRVIQTWQESMDKLRDSKRNKNIILSAPASGFQKLLNGAGLYHPNASVCSPVLILEDHTDEVQSVVISDDKKMIASCSHDKTVRIWNLENGVCQKVIYGHEDQVTTVAFSPSGKFVASGGIDRLVLLLSVETGLTILTCTGHSDWIAALCFTPDEKNIVSGAGYNDLKIRMWELELGTCVRTFDLAMGGAIMSLSFSDNGSILYGGTSNNQVCQWEVETAKSVGGILLQTSINNQGLHSVAVSKDGALVASGSEPTVRLWDMKSGDCIQSFHGHDEGYVLSVALSHDGRYVVSGSADYTVRVWNIATTECIRVFRQKSKAKFVAISKDGSLVVSCCEKRLHVWNVASGNFGRVMESVMVPPFLAAEITDVL